MTPLLHFPPISLYSTSLPFAESKRSRVASQPQSTTHVLHRLVRRHNYYPKVDSLIVCNYYVCSVLPLYHPRSSPLVPGKPGKTRWLADVSRSKWKCSQSKHACIACVVFKLFFLIIYQWIIE